MMSAYGIKPAIKARQVESVAFPISVISALLALVTLPLWPLYNDHFLPGIPVVTLSLLGIGVTGGVIGKISWIVREVQEGTYFE